MSASARWRRARRPGCASRSCSSEAAPSAPPADEPYNLPRELPEGCDDESCPYFDPYDTVLYEAVARRFYSELVEYDVSVESCDALCPELRGRFEIPDANAQLARMARR